MVNKIKIYILRFSSRILYFLKERLNFNSNKLWKIIYLLLPRKGNHIFNINGHKFIRTPNDHQQVLYLTGKSGFVNSDFIRSIREPFIFIDVGANHGVHCFDALNNPYLIACHAIEPNPQSFKILEENLSNNFYKQIYLHNLAIHISKKEIDLTIHPWHSGLSNLSGRGGSSKVKVKSSNHLLFDEIFNLHGCVPYIIKCDTEGLETIVLTCLVKSKIKNYIKTLLIEISPQWLDKESKLKLPYMISSLGFKSMRIRKILEKNLQKDLIFNKPKNYQFSYISNSF